MLVVVEKLAGTYSGVCAGGAVWSVGVRVRIKPSPLKGKRTLDPGFAKRKRSCSCHEPCTFRRLALTIRDHGRIVVALHGDYFKVAEVGACKNVLAQDTTLLLSVVTSVRVAGSVQTHVLCPC